MVRNLAREIHLMRDNHHGDVQVCQRFDDLQNLAGQLRIQRAGRFVEKQDLRIQRQSPGNGDALALTARKLGGSVIFFITE